MNAVALLAASFASIAVIGTLLAAAHDLLAAAVTRRCTGGRATDHGAPRSTSTVVFRASVDRPPRRASAIVGPASLRARTRTDGSVPVARA